MHLLLFIEFILNNNNRIFWIDPIYHRVLLISCTVLFDLQSWITDGLN